MIEPCDCKPETFCPHFDIWLEGGIYTLAKSETLLGDRYRQKWLDKKLGRKRKALIPPSSPLCGCRPSTTAKFEPHDEGGSSSSCMPCQQCAAANGTFNLKYQNNGCIWQSDETVPCANNPLWQLMITSNGMSLSAYNSDGSVFGTWENSSYDCLGCNNLTVTQDCGACTLPQAIMAMPVTTPEPCPSSSSSLQSSPSSIVAISSASSQTPSSTISSSASSCVIKYIQSAVNEQAFSSTPVTVSFTSNVTTGNAIVVSIGFFVGAGATIAVADNLGNVYHQIGTYVTNGSVNAAMWLATNVTGGSCTITATQSSAMYMVLGVHEYTSIGGVDQVVTSTGTSTAVSPGTIPVSFPTDMIFAMGTQGAINQSATVSSPFTLRLDYPNGSDIEALYTADYTPAATSQTPTFTMASSAAWSAMGVSFICGNVSLTSSKASSIVSSTSPKASSLISSPSISSSLSSISPKIISSSTQSTSPISSSLASQLSSSQSQVLINTGCCQGVPGNLTFALLLNGTVQFTAPIIYGSNNAVPTSWYGEVTCPDTIVNSFTLSCVSNIWQMTYGTIFNGLTCTTFASQFCCNPVCINFDESVCTPTTPYDCTAHNIGPGYTIQVYGGSSCVPCSSSFVAQSSSAQSQTSSISSQGSSSTNACVIQYIQSAVNSQAGSSTPVHVSFTSNVTTGNSIVVSIGFFESATISVTDNLGNVYHQIGTYVTNGSVNAGVWLATNVTGGSCTVTATQSSSVYMALGIHEYTSISGVDNFVSNTGSSGAVSPGAVPVSFPTDMIFAMGTQGSIDQTATVNSPFTLRLDYPNGAEIESLYTADFTPAATSQTPTFTMASGTSWSAIGISFICGAGSQSSSSPTIFTSSISMSSISISPVSISSSSTSNAGCTCAGCPMTGFSVWLWLSSGDTLTSFQYSITSAANGGTTYASGTATGDGTFIETNSFGYNIIKVDVPVSLLFSCSTTYWLNLSNGVSVNSSGVFWDQSSGPSQAFNTSYGSIPSSSFTISSGSNVLYNNDAFDGNDNAYPIAGATTSNSFFVACPPGCSSTSSVIVSSSSVSQSSVSQSAISTSPGSSSSSLTYITTCQWDSCTLNGALDCSFPSVLFLTIPGGGNNCSCLAGTYQLNFDATVGGTFGGWTTSTTSPPTLCGCPVAFQLECFSQAGFWALVVLFNYPNSSASTCGYELLSQKQCTCPTPGSNCWTCSPVFIQFTTIEFAPSNSSCTSCGCSTLNSSSGVYATISQ